MAKHVYTFTNPTSKRDLDEACRVLENDGVLVYPTDVNWAFGVNAESSKAIEKIRQLKPHHPKDRPFSLLCSSISMMTQIANLENHAYCLLKKLLPGPYTILLESNKNLSRKLKDKRKTVGVRFPDSPLLTDLVEVFQKPILNTSIPFEKNGLTFGYQIEESYGHLVDLILDLGDEVFSLETTVLDMSQGGITILREGEGDLNFVRSHMLQGEA